MISPSCFHPASPHYGKLQLSSAIGGTLLTACAIATAMIPQVYAITTFILPIVLGVGALVAWTILLALTINRCTYKPPNREQNVPIQVQNDPTAKKSFSEICLSDKKRFLVSIEKLKENSCDYKVIETAAELLYQSTVECASAVEDEESRALIKKNFKEELENLFSVAKALIEGSSEGSSKLNEIAAFNEFAQLLEAYRANKPFAADDLVRAETLLSQLGDINVSRTRADDTPLMLLAKSGRPIEFIDLFVKHGADFNLTESLFGNTPLIWAIANANNEMALEIILKAKQDLDIRDSGRGNSALVLAIAKGYTTHDGDGAALNVTNFQLVEALLARGANPNLKDRNDLSPLKMAAIRRNAEMVEALLKAGAVIDFDVNEVLNLSYSEAGTLLKQQAVVYLLDKELFETSKPVVEKLLSKT
jgi:ankyrin repeat protein